MNNKQWEMIAKDYNNFTMKFKKELEDNYSIDCGTDYADFIGVEE